MTEINDAGAELQDPHDHPKIILAAIDASSSAPRVVSMAARMTHSMPGAGVHVVHVFRASKAEPPRFGTPADSANRVAEIREHLDHHVRMLRKQCRALVTGHLELGDPATEILRLATALDVDMLVVGTHDYVGFERFLLGSVAETLMRKAGCPVLVVRSKAHPRE